MATFDLTSKDTTGVSSDSIVAMPSAKNTNVMRNIEAYLDIDDLVACWVASQMEIYFKC